jgi:hypothetical protein
MMRNAYLPLVVSGGSVSMSARRARDVPVLRMALSAARAGSLEARRARGRPGLLLLQAQSVTVLVSTW